MLLKNYLVVKMNNEDFEKKLKEFAGKEVLIFEDTGYVYTAVIFLTIFKNSEGLYKIDEYDHKHDYWSLSYVNPEGIVEIRRYDWKEKIGFEGIINEKTEPMEVPDFPEEEIKECKQGIENYFEKNDSINPWKYAEKNNIDVKLVLLCIDNLINEGKIEWQKN